MCVPWSAAPICSLLPRGDEGCSQFVEEGIMDMCWMLVSTASYDLEFIADFQSRVIKYHEANKRASLLQQEVTST